MKPDVLPSPQAQPRREFLRRTAALAAMSAAAQPARAAEAPGAREKLDVAFMGLNSRGAALVTEFLATQRVNVAWLCDVDRTAVEKVGAAVKKKQVRAFKTTDDFRTVLEDRRVAAIVMATPDHWHAPAAILALKANKPVYLEKPVSHNPREGEILVQVQKSTGVPIQVGLQRRSLPWVIEAVERLRRGDFGIIRSARAWYAADRKTIGFGQLAAVPETLNYPLWQGPAPVRPFRDNVIHYNWHWFWHWGTGELGNNGVHFLDLARWALDLSCPTRVTSAGGRHHFEDDQETPDTQFVAFEFPGLTLTWEHRSCLPTPTEGEATGIAFLGSKATLIVGGSRYRVLGLDGKELERVDGKVTTEPHITNFLDAIENPGKTLRCSALEGHLSTLLCHLGNISQRTGQALVMNPKTRQIVEPKSASQFWGRDYAPGWQPTT